MVDETGTDGLNTAGITFARLLKEQYIKEWTINSNIIALKGKYLNEINVLYACLLLILRKYSIFFQILGSNW